MSTQTIIPPHLPNPPEGAFYLENVRLRYESLDRMRTPSNSPGAEPRYQAAVLLPKADPRADQLWALIQAAAVAEFGAQTQSRWPSLRMFMTDGDLPSNTGRVDEVAKGHWLIQTNNKETKPLLGGDMAAVGPETFYPGCWINLMAHLFAYPQGGVTAWFDGVQFVRNDERLASGAPSVNQMFGAVQGAEASNAGTVPGAPAAPATSVAPPGAAAMPSAPPPSPSAPPPSPGAPAAPAATVAAPPPPGQQASGVPPFKP